MSKNVRKKLSFRKNILTFLLGGDRHSDLESLMLRSETLDSECHHNLMIHPPIQCLINQYKYQMTDQPMILSFESKMDK